MKWITKLAWSWGDDRLKAVDFNPYPTVNIIHGDKVFSGRAGHKILCYDPPAGRHRDFELAWRKLPKRQRECVEVRFVLGSVCVDGVQFTKRQLAKAAGLSKARFAENVQRGLTRIQYLIDAE